MLTKTKATHLSTHSSPFLLGPRYTQSGTGNLPPLHPVISLFHLKLFVNLITSPSKNSTG